MNFYEATLVRRPRALLTVAATASGLLATRQLCLARSFFSSAVVLCLLSMLYQFGTFLWRGMWWVVIGVVFWVAQTTHKRRWVCHHNFPSDSALQEFRSMRPGWTTGYQTNRHACGPIISRRSSWWKLLGCLSDTSIGPCIHKSAIIGTSAYNCTCVLAAYLLVHE